MPSKLDVSQGILLFTTWIQNGIGISPGLLGQKENSRLDCMRVCDTACLKSWSCLRQDMHMNEWTNCLELGWRISGNASQSLLLVEALSWKREFRKAIFLGENLNGNFTCRRWRTTQATRATHHKQPQAPRMDQVRIGGVKGCVATPYGGFRRRLPSRVVPKAPSLRTSVLERSRRHGDAPVDDRGLQGSLSSSRLSTARGGRCWTQGIEETPRHSDAPAHLWLAARASPTGRAEWVPTKCEWSNSAGLSPGFLSTPTSATIAGNMWSWQEALICVFFVSGQGLTIVCAGLLGQGLVQDLEAFRRVLQDICDGNLCEWCPATLVHMGRAIDDMRHFFFFLTELLRFQNLYSRNSYTNALSRLSSLFVLCSCPWELLCIQRVRYLIFFLGVGRTLPLPISLQLQLSLPFVLRNRRMLHMSLGLTETERYGQHPISVQVKGKAHPTCN